MRSTRRTANRQDGSALIIALVFVTAISLIVAAVLSFADVGVRASRTYKQKSLSAYAADGAIAAAMKRYSTTGPCDNYTAPLVQGSPDTAVNGQGVIVRCQGPAPAASKAKQPLNSLLSLGQGAGNGTGDGITSTQELRLLGDVYSNTTVDTNATMVVQGEVSAVGRCTGPIQTVPTTPLRCSNTVPPAPPDTSRGRDPEYVPATTAVPARPAVPGCPAGWLVPLEPGYYDDAEGLNRLTGRDPVTNATYCDNKVVWLKPGTYYFDLGFRGGVDNAWRVDNPSVVIVGGTPKNWDPKAADRPTLSVPGSCKTENDPGPGVQLIAGGATRLDVVKGRMELCATPSATDQQIALFGLGPDIPTRTLEASDIQATGFTPALNAQTIGETPVATATAALDAGAAPQVKSASLELNAFRPRVPLGSVIDAVSLRVVHSESGDPVKLTWTAAFPDGPCQAPKAFPPPGPDGSRVDLKVDCGLNRPEQFAALAVTYAVTLAAGSTTAGAQVDGVVVEVAYRTPVTRKPTVVQAFTGFFPPENALEIDEQPPVTADAAFTSSIAPPASITLGGFGDPPLAADATIDSAVLRVTHQDIGYPGPKVTFAGDTCNNLVLPPRPSLTDDRIDLKACGLSTPDKLKGLTATFTAELVTDANSKLDGIWLEVVSSGGGTPPPTVRQPANAASTPTPPGVTAFATPDAAKVIGETPTPLTADANISGAATTAALTVDDFKGIALPTGSKITSAKLRVAHQEDANVDSVSVSTNLGCPATLPNSVGALTTDPVNLTSCLTSPDQLAGLAATYTAIRTTTATAAKQIPAMATGDGFLLAQENGRVIGDGNVAVADLGPSLTTASVKLEGYDQPRLPPGSIIDTATLRIAHQDDGSTATAAVSFPGNTCTAAEPLKVQLGGIGVDEINLKDCGLTDPSQLTGTAGLNVVYRADLTPGSAKATDSLDGVELVLTYRPPAVDKLDGIELDLVFEAPALRPLAGPAGFNLLKVTPATTPSLDTTTRFVAGGTIYSPTAGADISMYDLDTQVLRRGLIARSIRLGLKSKDGFKRPTGAIPPEIVTFTAYPDETLAPTSFAPAPCPAGAKGCFMYPGSWAAMRDGLTADAGLDATNQTASLDLSGYQTDLPGEARFDAAVLRVRHQDVGTTVVVKVWAGTANNPGTDPPCAIQTLAPNPAPLTPGGSDGEDQIMLPAACGVDRPDRLARIIVRYEVALDAAAATTATAKLDGITLEVLSGPLVRAEVTFAGPKATVVEYSVLR